MAVIQTKPAAEVCAGISVSIDVDRRLLREYDTINDDVKHALPHIATYQKGVTVTKYIEATSGKAFGVKFIVQKPFQIEGYTQLGFATSVNGERIGGPMMTKDKFEMDGKCAWEHVMKDPINKVGGVFKGKMIFGAANIISGSLATTDLKADVGSISQIGEIVVFVHKLVAKDVSNQESKMISSALDAGSKAHSKTLILEPKSNSLVLGDDPKPVPSKKYNVRYIDGKDLPLAIFRFKYCSRDILESLFIVPRVPSLALPQAVAVPQKSPSPPPKKTVIAKDLSLAVRSRSASANPDNGRADQREGDTSPTAAKQMRKIAQPCTESMIKKMAPTISPAKRGALEAPASTSTNNAKKKKLKVTVTIDLTSDSEEE